VCKRLGLALAVGCAALWLAPGAFASGWCGAGENAGDLPDAVTAQQVHAIYVVPSDGADQFSTVANQIADDTSSIDTWWAGQDPTRDLRFDQAVYSTCTGLDISFLRLPVTAAQISAGGAENAFAAMLSQLEEAGFSNPYKDYLVYYDGPSVETDVCGTGGGNFDAGPGYAIVWMQGCPGIPTDGIAAHELLHALGAVPDGDPHACPGDSAHVCDNPLDVLYPYASGDPLSSLFLDFNHDDYYGHSGSWPDIQDSPWLHLLQVPQVALGVTLVGSGDVTSDLPGVACTTSCSTQWDPGSKVTLHAAPTPPLRFVGWQGACSGQADCLLTLAQAQNVTAVFGPSTVAFHVRISGHGRVACTPHCATAYTVGVQLHLHAVPAKGWKFAGWGGACTGLQLACAPSTQATVTVHATFKRLPPKPKALKKKKKG
jgi:Divergent InlB B-repeat domain